MITRCVAVIQSFVFFFEKCFGLKVEKRCKIKIVGTQPLQHDLVNKIYLFYVLFKSDVQIQGNRDESDEVVPEAAFKDAQALLQAGELLFAGTDESVFNAVMCQRNRPQLRLIFEEYEKLVGHPIETAIENEFSGNIKDALLQLIHCIKDRSDYLATRLHDSMAGIGTDDRTLVRIVVSRSEIDLEEIKEVYEAKYGKSLAERIGVSILLFNYQFVVYLCRLQGFGDFRTKLQKYCSSPRILDCI